MNFQYAASNVFIEIYIETLTLVVSAVLLFLYYRKKINIFEVLLFGIATGGLALFVIGPTISTIYFISTVFFADEAILFIRGKTTIHPKFFLLLLLPLGSSLIIFFLATIKPDLFFYPSGKFAFFIRPLYFYFKYYLPLFAIGSKIIRNKNTLNFKAFFDAVKKVCQYSLVVAILQIIAIMVFHNTFIAQISGSKMDYMGLGGESDVTGFRVQAFFIEPKFFASFLAIAIPVFVKDKQYKTALLCLIIAILTQSQTFYINVVCAFIIFILLNRFKNVRAKILITLASIVLIFAAIAGLQGVIIDNYLEHQDNVFYKLIGDRAVARYNPADDRNKTDNMVLGLPLQSDLEFPIFMFFTDHVWLLPIGYGPGNSTFIDASYFIGQSNYERHLAGTGATSISMRWFFIIVEFGLVFFVVFFIMFTSSNKFTQIFEDNYFAYIWLCMFFSEIDIVFIMVILLYYYAKYKNQNANNLAPCKT